jgi:hypothetical protein
MKERAKLCRSRLLLVRQSVGVDVKRHLDLRVSEARRDHMHGRSGLEPARGAASLTVVSQFQGPSSDGIGVAVLPLEAISHQTAAETAPIKMPAGGFEIRAVGKRPPKTNETASPIRAPATMDEATLTPTVALTSKYAGTPRTMVTTAATGKPPIEMRMKRKELLMGVFRLELSCRTIEVVSSAAWIALATNTTAAKAGLIRVKTGLNQSLWSRSRAPCSRPLSGR